MVVALLALPAAAAETETGDDLPSYEGWYQVDVILFRPRSTDLDEESWPEDDPSFPADMVSVNKPTPFKLSLVEQTWTPVDAATETAEDAPLSRDEFLFERESRSRFNREILESVTGPSAAGEDDAPVVPDPDAEVDATLATRVEPLSFEPSPGAYGEVAFSDSIDDSTLKRIAGSLNRSSRYDMLEHLSWIQPIESEPTPIMIQSGNRYDDRFELEGTLNIFRTRFLHVQTDLWYTVFEPRGGGANPFRLGFESSLPDDVLREYSDLVEVERERGQYFPSRSHVMRQSRRIRSGELHYIDHPLFGVIVRFTRYQPES